MSKFSLSSILNNRKYVLIISFVLAIIFWFTITVVENPESERVVKGIKVYFDTTGSIVEQQKLSAIDYDDSTEVSVKIKGPNYIVNSVTTEDILVEPSFEGVNASGKYTLELTATSMANKKFTIESVFPKNLKVEFDYIDTVSFDLQAKVINASPQEGLVLGTERFTNTDDAKLEISGPRSIVSRIESAVAEADAKADKKLSATKSYEAVVKLFDEDGKEISTDGLTLGFKTISVSLPVYKTKTVPIKCTYTNKPSEYTPDSVIKIGGKRATKIEIEGSPEILDKISFIELEPIDFRMVNPDKSKFTQKVVLPSGVFSVKDIESAVVSIDTSSLKTKTFDISKISVINNTKNYKVKLDTNLSVTLCGKDSVIDSLNSSNLYAEIDIQGKTLGGQSLSAIIKSSVKDNVWQLDDCNAKITISE